MAFTISTNKYLQWKEHLCEKYEKTSVRKEEINEHNEVLKYLKDEVNNMMQNMEKEREKDMKILKSELSVKLSNYFKELHLLKNEMEEKMKEWENARANFVPFSSCSSSRKNKRKFSEIQEEEQEK